MNVYCRSGEGVEARENIKTLVTIQFASGESLFEMSTENYPVAVSISLSPCRG